MLALPDVSLLCLDTRHPDLALKAMQRCLDRARFREAVLLTRDGYGSPDPRITARAVPTLRNVAEYSHFMVKSLGPYFSGSHVLIMQWDSFIVDPQAWDAAFLDYDYIGAPWPHRRQPVGNGGFSLRSRRLIDALQDADIRETQPEDHVICLDYHDLLVARHGIRFAPVDVASRFAFELTPPKGSTFGFHGFFNFHLAMPDAELQAWLGPCIGPTAFEVGADVRAAFCDAPGALGAAAAQCFVARPDAPGKFLCDLAGLARLRLQAMGITAIYGNDSTAPWCTVTQASRFFSHRRDSVALGGSGRFAACIWRG